jgi:pyridoxal phosphate enzyme (YggS family)
MSTIADNIFNIKKSIASAASKTGHISEDINLVCVTKFTPIEKTLEAVSAGIRIIGESRTEEAAHKKEKLPTGIEMHLIGHLQSRKAKDAVELFDLIHSVDSISLAKEINKRAANIGKVQKILLEINISGEASKYGIKPNDAFAVLKEISILQNVKVLGLMTMAPLEKNVELTRPVFRALKQLSEKIKSENINNVDIKYLSMGMSQDYIIAVEEGSNMVRIGSAIFSN